MHTWTVIVREIKQYSTASYTNDKETKGFLQTLSSFYDWTSIADQFPCHQYERPRTPQPLKYRQLLTLRECFSLAGRNLRERFIQACFAYVSTTVQA